MVHFLKKKGTKAVTGMVPLKKVLGLVPSPLRCTL